MKAVIDRIENETAIILLGDDEVLIHVPLRFLPENVSEGTWLRLDFQIDRQTTQERYRNNKYLLNRLIKKNQRNK